MEELPHPLVVEILSRLRDPTDVARCRMVSKRLEAASYEVRSVNLVCTVSRHRKSRSPETKHLVTPFKTIFKKLVRRCSNLESISIMVHHTLSSWSTCKPVDESDDLYLTDCNFLKEWLPDFSHKLKSLSIFDCWDQSGWRRSETLSLIASTCRNLVKLDITNAWLSVDGLCAMPTLAFFTLASVRLDDEALSKINACFPNLRHLEIFGVRGLKEPKIDLPHLTTCRWFLSSIDELVSYIICAPCLVDFTLRCPSTRLILLDTPSLSNFNLYLTHTDELRLKNCANIQCLELRVDLERLSLGFMVDSLRHCSAVKRLTINLVPRRAGRWVFELDVFLNNFPDIEYLKLVPGAWYMMEKSFQLGGLEYGIRMPKLKELVAYLLEVNMDFTLAFICTILDKCTKLSDVYLLIHSDVDSCVAGNLKSACRTKFPRVRWRWGIC